MKIILKKLQQYDDGAFLIIGLLYTVSRKGASNFAVHPTLQGGPAKVRPTYIFDGNI